MIIRVSVLLFAALLVTCPTHGGELPTGFENMEIEAKFLVPDLRTYERIRNLKEEQFEGYEIEFRYERLFVDKYFDTVERGLYARDGVLRLRVRYRDAPGEELRDMRFQAKDATKKIKSVFFRNEIRGPKADDGVTSATFIESQLANDSTDEAVLLARKLAGGPFKPVLEVRDVRVRYFIKKDGVDLFEVSLDRGQMIGLDDNKASAYFYECEVEYVGDRTEGNVRALIDFSESFKSRFGLLTSPDSKYRRAIRKVVDNSRSRTMVIVVRHAEKTGNNDEDPLSELGMLRAQDLKRTLSEIKVDEVYVSNAKRTQQTAGPLAEANGVDIQIQNLPSRFFAAKIRQQKYHGKNILVVTHHPTVRELLREFTGHEITFGDEYDNLFVVTLLPDRKATFVRQRYGRPFAREAGDN